MVYEAYDNAAKDALLTIVSATDTDVLILLVYPYMASIS